MSTTISEPIETAPEYDVRSKRGEPTWEMAHQFPRQGEWSEEEYLALDTGRIVEFTNGVLEFHPMSTPLHQRIVAFLFRLLDAFVQECELGEVLFAPCPVRVGSGKYRQPDIFFLREDRITDPTKPPQGAELMIEVVSPGEENRERDLVQKRKEYAAARVPEYWIVDPGEMTVTVFTLSGRRYRTHGKFGSGETATSRLLPGFDSNVDDIFAAGRRKPRKDRS